MVEEAAVEPDARAHRRPALIFAAVVGAWLLLMWYNAGSGRAPVSCGAGQKPDQDTVVMLSASWCGYCRRARAFLQGAAIKHCEYDIETSAEGRRLFENLAVKVIPVLMIRGDTLVGFNRTEIMQTLAAHGLAEFND